MTQVTHKDIKACRLCVPGARRWFKRHGLDWGVFVSEGMPAEVLLGTGDGLAERVVAAAIKREADSELRG